MFSNSKNLAECMVLLRYDNFNILNNDIALYGNGIRHTVFGGTGSGEVNDNNINNIEKEFILNGYNIKTNDWLDKYDIEFEKAKIAFKKYLKKKAKQNHQMLFIASMGEVMKEPEYNIDIDVVSNTAIYVLSRNGGEGADREFKKGDILLTDTEIKNIRFLSDNYENFMLVINTGFVIDLKPLDNVKNILYLSQLGKFTSKALLDVLLKKYSPSGHLTTTWTYHNDYQQIGDFTDSNDTNYIEGLYVGYRYFDSIKKDVLFPFGFGLTYSKFEYLTKNIELINDYLSFDIKIKNIGKFKTKEVIQIYVSKNINKNRPYQELIAFTKTKELDINEEELVNIKINIKDLKIYDENLNAYIIAKGNYIFKIGNNSRNTKAILDLNIIDDKIIKRVMNIINKPLFDDYIVNVEYESYNDIKHIEYNPLNIDEEIVDYNKEYEIEEEIKNLSTEELIKYNLGYFNPKGGLLSLVGNSSKSVAGAAGETCNILGNGSLVMADGPQGLRLAPSYFIDKKGIHSNTLPLPESMIEYMPKILKSILKLSMPKPKKNTEIKYNNTIVLPIASSIASSFNKDLAYNMGFIIGAEMEKFNVDLWLAPAMNIIRDVRCGRNFEYYSEDPYLTGIISSCVINGVTSHKNKGAVIKHFIANNKEYNRYINSSNLSEKTLREIYLKGFEICLNNSNPQGIMTSYNLINGIHTSENININDRLIKEELNFNGIIMTDWVVRGMAKGNKYDVATAKHALKSHTTIFMPGSKYDYKSVLKGLKNNQITRKDLEINASRLYRFIKNNK